MKTSKVQGVWKLRSGFAFRPLASSSLHVLLHIHQLGHDLPLVPPRVVPVGVLLGLLLSSLLSTVPRHHSLILVVVVMLKLVKTLLSSISSISHLLRLRIHNFGFSCRSESSKY